MEVTIEILGTPLAARPTAASRRNLTHTVTPTARSANCPMGSLHLSSSLLLFIPPIPSTRNSATGFTTPYFLISSCLFHSQISRRHVSRIFRSRVHTPCFLIPISFHSANSVGEEIGKEDVRQSAGDLWQSSRRRSIILSTHATLLYDRLDHLNACQWCSHSRSHRPLYI